ncbi:hypothetical protein ACFOYU_15630 [Microvirga sp. GCM10011540]|uniref:hypothetical protein n=1 Tax=Microvirga sp. GCM10011540 TaxID=3317338 RepID=UPI003621A61B
MQDRTVFLIKPDGSVGYEFHGGLLPEGELEVEARKAALRDNAGSHEEIATWTFMAPAAPQEQDNSH